MSTFGSSRRSAGRRIIVGTSVLALGMAAVVSPAWAAGGQEPDTPGVAPAAPGGPRAHGRMEDAWVHATMSRMSLRQKVGQLFTTYVHGTDPNAADPANVEEFGVATPAEVVSKYHLGGVIYFENDHVQNIDDPKQVARLSNGLQRSAVASGAHIPLNISTDQEEGIVTRIKAPATRFPGSMALGAGRSTEDAKQAAEITGAEMRAMGINVNNAPDADVNSNPKNPVIGVRSFGSDPDLVSDFVTAQVSGYQDHVSATAKHFPGHGDAATDSHTGLPVIEHTKEQWEKLDAPPFRAAIAAGIDQIMTAHLSFPKIDPSGEPATLSPTIMTGLLRDELGYDGVVITDSLQMQGVRTLHPDAQLPVLALQAGADVMLMPAKLGLAIDSVCDAVHDGTLTEDRIDTSVERVLRQKFRNGVVWHPFVNRHTVSDTVGTKEHLAAARRITDRTITAVRNDDGVLPLAGTPENVLVSGWGQSTTATLADDIGARGSHTSAVPTGASPTDEQIDRAVTAAKDADLAVVLTHGLSGDKQQRALLERLTATGTPVVAVGVGTPYGVGYVPDAATWLETYSYTAVSMRSLTKVLFGDTSPQGKLPVDVPDGADPSQVMYPLGYGLTW